MMMAAPCHDRPFQLTNLANGDGDEKATGPIGGTQDGTPGDVCNCASGLLYGWWSGGTQRKDKIGIYYVVRVSWT